MSQHPRLTTPLVGHTDNVRWFCEAFSRGKLPHALLLQGPKGVGKATFAYHAARALLAQTPSFTQDAQDPLFRRVGARAHGDLFVLEQTQDEDGKVARDIPIASARALKASFARTAMEGGWRVGIVDSVDTLTPQGAQALLKLLEEPPQKCCLLLIHHGAPLLPTIVSRCQVVTFGGLGTADAQVVIGRTHEGAALSQDLLTLYEGSVGSVMDFLDTLGSSFLADFDALVQGYSQGRTPSYAPFMETHFPARGAGVMAKVDLFVDFLMRWTRQSLVGSFGQTASPQVQAFTARRTPDAWTHTWSALGRLKNEGMRLNFDPRHVLILSLESFLNGATPP